MSCRSFVAWWLALIALIAGSAGAGEPKAQGSAGGQSWIFSQGQYSNNPATGGRVWQYEQKQTVYRDPNALNDSPRGDYPFVTTEPDEFAPYYHHPSFSNPEPLIPAIDSSAVR